MNFFDKIKSFLERKNQEPILVEQFFVTLRANLEQVKDINDNNKKDSLSIIDNILNKKNKTWSNAYEIERLLIDLYDEDNLDVELNRRLIEAERSLFNEEYIFYQKQIEHTLKEDKNIAFKRYLLSRLTNDLQWRFSIRQTKRVHSIFIRNLVSVIFIVATFTFFMVLKSQEKLNEFCFMIALITGFWGASFSMIVGLNDRLKSSSLDDLRILKSISFVVSRAFVGVGASLILYFFICSQSLEGTIFPDLTSIHESNTMQIVDYKNLSLLVIWSFIAGFSEKFIPNLLSKTEKDAKV